MDTCNGCLPKDQTRYCSACRKTHKLHYFQTSTGGYAERCFGCQISRNVLSQTAHSQNPLQRQNRWDEFLRLTETQLQEYREATKKHHPNVDLKLYNKEHVWDCLEVFLQQQEYLIGEYSKKSSGTHFANKVDKPDNVSQKRTEPLHREASPTSGALSRRPEPSPLQTIRENTVYGPDLQENEPLTIFNRSTMIPKSPNSKLSTGKCSKSLQAYTYGTLESSERCKASPKVCCTCFIWKDKTHFQSHERKDAEKSECIRCRVISHVHDYLETSPNPTSRSERAKHYLEANAMAGRFVRAWKNFVAISRDAHDWKEVESMASIGAIQAAVDVAYLTFSLKKPKSPCSVSERTQCLPTANKKRKYGDNDDRSVSGQTIEHNTKIARTSLQRRSCARTVNEQQGLGDNNNKRVTFSIPNNTKAENVVGHTLKAQFAPIRSKFKVLAMLVDKAETSYLLPKYSEAQLEEKIIEAKVELILELENMQ